jgi:16S rRNA (guanine527-N7)-methyltransferase
VGKKATAASLHRAALEALGIADPALTRLTLYLDTLAGWSRRVNLTGARSPVDRVRVLVGDVLPALPFVEAGTLLDIGSGNGSPGLVFALLRDDLQTTLLEPRVRRWAFLREAVRAAGAAGVEIQRTRHDAYQGLPARTVTLRALSVPLAELSRLVLPGGRLLVLGARPDPAAPFVPKAGTPVGVHVFESSDVSRET